MCRVLVVEDSVVERNLVVRLLARRPEWQVSVAADGLEALEAIRREPPDLVLTDVRMPWMDGLQLLDAVRQERPGVPVVIMTAFGSEEIALRALRCGAASYVPKRFLAKQLFGVVEGVLAAGRTRQINDALLDLVERSEVSFVVPNDRGLVPPLIAHLQDGGVRVGAFAAGERTRVGVALEEALANAIVHGNLEVGSELRERGDGSFERFVELRRGQRPYADRRVRVTAALAAGEAVFSIRDEGPGFDVAALPDPTDPENLVKPHGRGLLLMRSFMDEVRYNAAGNEVTLVKRFAPASLPTDDTAAVGAGR